MGKKEKKQRHQQKHSRRTAFPDEDEEEYSLPSSAFSSSVLTLSVSESDEEGDDENDDGLEVEDENEGCPSTEIPSKFLLYQQSVQSPKGDISYLQKFFLMYVGGRLPLHFQEDFCGTALLSTEWLRSDSRRTAVGLDLDLESLRWCLENNINKIGADGYSRIFLFHGNVLHPSEAKVVNFEPQEVIKNISLEEKKDGSAEDALGSTILEGSTSLAGDKYTRNLALPARDIVCAFNYSCCCLHSRADLVLYFKHSLAALSKKGGIFVMDLYGGTSSERKLRLQRRFANFTYVWEQAEFDIIERKTRISLHFHFQKQQKKLRHAFSYSWRLWSLPEIKDCLEEAGFRSVHFWLRQMPDTGETKSTVGFGAGRDIKYEEMKHFEQQDAWNAYIIGVA
ncbi:S-adenosyl-L-methionine-dependent methyltransferase [Parasponia andersonii]|uniref:S-adenosyl-L-methionine-dependent methyltransferase n=1 Tax=Parasponia andersonii TaxID=3476 RepID=A0A2P5BNC7_PARAD|nr:S-adenosyl-L-methionine-dependent methyltransferase [Parasponia andersonii]